MKYPEVDRDEPFVFRDKVEPIVITREKKMTLYTAEIWLDEDNICNECPCHDDYIIADAPKCKLGDFYMVRENRGKSGTANLVTPRPRGCPLKAVEG